MFSFVQVQIRIWREQILGLSGIRTSSTVTTVSGGCFDSPTGSTRTRAQIAHVHGTEAERILRKGLHSLFRCTRWKTLVSTCAKELRRQRKWICNTYHGPAMSTALKTGEIASRLEVMGTTVEAIALRPSLLEAKIIPARDPKQCVWGLEL